VGLRLSRAEAFAEIAAAHTGILVSLRRDGVPIALPVWHVVLDARIYVGAPAHSKKIARVRRDPRVSYLVESGERWIDLRGVHVTGLARIVDDDPDLVARVASETSRKYAGFAGDRAAMPDDTRGYYERPRAMIEIVPDDRILSWVNANLFADED